MDLSFLRSEVSDAIQVHGLAIPQANSIILPSIMPPQSNGPPLQVLWGKEPSGQFLDTFHLPGSTCTEGRNHLLQQALMLEKAQGMSFSYMIFTEDDSELEEVLTFSKLPYSPPA